MEVRWSTSELENALGCLGEQLMCHQSCCRPTTSGVLGEDIKKNLEWYSGYVELSWVLKCS